MHSPRHRLTRLSAIGAWIAATCLLGRSAAHARPEAPMLLCEWRMELAHCQGRLPDCATCHASIAPVTWNDYGQQLLGAWTGDSFADRLGNALDATDALDADADGHSNATELLEGSHPANADSRPPACTTDTATDTGSAGLAADPTRTFARIHILYCGRSPSFEARAAFAEAPDPYAALHETLDACLQSAYWRDQGLHRIADRLIQPISTFGHDSPIGAVLADFRWDYRLFAYVMTEERDVRDLLRADYHVEQTSDGQLRPVEGVIQPDVRTTLGLRGGQLLETPHRAGMLTSQWFLVYNTMISDLPRATAARAYLAYLGYDIAELEGLYPVPDEPRDVDAKGVAAPECATCHSTLDPLSYAFASYEGLVQPGGGGAQGVFNASRPTTRIPGWGDAQPMILGEPVDDLKQWAARAAESDAFARNLTMLLFEHAVDREPLPHEGPAFDALWRGLPADQWSANRLLHRLVDTPMFGGGR